jgi:excinuclease UvrABC nuclease subunit
MAKPPAVALKREPRSGVYFLTDENGEVVYIGASKDVDNRASSHKHKGYDMYFIPHSGDAQSLREAEQKYIDEYKPRLNVNSKSAYHGVYVPTLPRRASIAA